MNDTKYLKIMIELGEDLEEVSSSEPFNRDNYNKVIDAIKSTNRIWWRSRRRRPWLVFVVILFLLCAAAYGLFRIAFHVEPL